MYLYVYILYINASARDLSAYNLIAYSSKNSCGIAQLDVGYETYLTNSINLISYSSTVLLPCTKA
jgi:hypothetical protein